MKKSGPRPSSCIFCGDGRLTDEDVFPKWMARMFEGPGNRRGLSVTGQAVTRRITSANLIVRRVVCGTCNSGWMSRLQTSAKPLLERMILGSSITVRTHAQLVIIAWATMTAMVMDFSPLPMPGPMYSQDERSRFYRDRQIPAGTTVWLGHRAALPDTEVLGWQIDGFLIALKGQPRPDIEGHNVFINTGVFGHLVLQLLVQRPDSGLPDISRITDDLWSDRTVHLDARPLETVSWPPRRPLEAGDMESFLERWARA